MDERQLEATWQRGPRALLVLAAMLAGLVLLAGPAGAQEDPYGSTSTTAEAGVEASCELSSEVGGPGSEVTATVTDVRVGETVRLLFDGEEVGRATAEQGDGQTGVGTVQIRFEVPEVDDGSYQVTAVGSTFSADCSAGFSAGGAQVLGFTVERGTGSAGGASTGGGSALARTGVAIALLVAVALALLIVGRSFLETSRRTASTGTGGRE